MKIFNLAKFRNQEIDTYVNRQVEAMAGPPQWNRPRYDWWDLDKLVRSGDERWKELCAQNPKLNKDLNRLFIDAKRIRTLWLRKLMDEKWYMANMKEAMSMLKTYIGYDPHFGGYVCQVGPYMSEGYIWGPEHKREKAKDRFGYYMWRRQKADPKEIVAHIAKNFISKYQSQYGLELTPADFKMIIKTSSDSEDVQSGRGKRKDVDEVIESLDFSNPEIQKRFEENPPMLGGGGSEIKLNDAGIKKIEAHDGGKLMRDLDFKLKSAFPKEYEICVQKRAIDEKKPIDIVRQEMITSFDTLRKVWTNTRNMISAKLRDPNSDKSGIPVNDKGQLAWTAEPIKTLSKPGQQQFSTISDSQDLVSALDLRLEVLETVSKLYEMFKTKQTLKSILPNDLRTVTSDMVSDKDLISKILNEHPGRIDVGIARDIENQIGKRHSAITPDEVGRQLELISIARNREGKQPKTYGQLIAETHKVKAQASGSLGYEDAKTAIEALSLHLSGQKIDKSTRARVGEVNDVLFNPKIIVLEPGEQASEDDGTALVNWTSSYLQELREKKEQQFPETVGKVESSKEAGEKTDEESQKPLKEEKKKKLTTEEMPSPEINKPIPEPTLETTPAITEPTANEPVVQKPMPEIKVPSEKSKPSKIKPESKPMVKNEAPKAKTPVPVKKQPLSEKPKPKVKTKEKGLISNTLVNLIKVAEKLDKEGKSNAAEEIHKIIRKYQERI